ncbi:glycerate kinase [Paroceanicella profunda]|uniref:Glycerate kinase n=1 Tax=Paroceanicella profunda TaxID=2579971 RepID=A0A5B8FHT3_9RHOB|nr:glycerate kinase [Paroceanicella profunda]QDL92328.1 glycerate kinase [Paroceanicella profunda]
MSGESDFLRRLFEAAVDAARPARIVAGHLPAAPAGRVVVVGAGKASAAMAAELERRWPGPLAGLVITRYGHEEPCAGIGIASASHPVPDEAGAAAAARMMELVAGLGPDDLVIALISGGGSALMPLPAPGLTLADKQAVNRALLACGASIDEMNCLRRHLSGIKGGRLAAACHPARVVTLMISDVPGDDPINIASGPTVADPTTLADARAIVAKYGLELSPQVRAALEDPANESVKPGDPRLARAEAHVVAAPLASLEAAAGLARAEGHDPEILGDALEGEARELGRAMGRQALALRAEGRGALLISGGETTVTLPKDGREIGAGGRNVDFLLGLAEVLDGAPGIHAIACDTDGVDGATEVAGAVIGPDTLARAAQAGYPLARALERFDGHGFFEAAGAQVVTGPTRTNVNDFRAILVTA